MRPLLALLLVVGSGCPGTEAEPPPDPVPCELGFVDDGGVCVPAACGTGPWGDLEPHLTEPTIWVDADAAAPGDGTTEAPFPRLSSALEAAVEVSGGRVLVADGHYRERLSFNRAHDGLELVGRCADLVRVDGEGLAAPTLSIFASAVVVRDMTITGGRPGVIAGEVPGAPGLVLRGNGLVIASNGGYGVLATGQGVLVDLAASVVRDVWPTNEVSPGRGVGVEQGARLVGVDVTVESAQGVGVEVRGDGEAELEGLRIDGMRSLDDGSWGRGVHVSGGELVLRGGRVAAPPEQALGVEAGGRCVLEDTELDGGAGHVARVVGGGQLLATRASLASAGGLALQALGNNSLIELTDSTIRAEGATAGPLVSVEQGAALLAEGSSLVGGYGVGLHVAGAGALAALDATAVEGTTAGDPDFAPGIGVLVTDSGDLEGASLTVADSGGPGLFAARGGELRCDGCAVVRSVFAGAAVSGEGALVLEGAQIDDVDAHPELQGGVGVLGLGAAGGATSLLVDGVDVNDTEHAGVAARGAGSWRVFSSTIRQAGTASSAPGVLATEGTSWWVEPSGPGLWIFGVAFSQLPNDGILLDGATATISGNTFASIGQLELYTQNCGGVLPPDVAEDLDTNDCVGPPRVLGPPLAWPAPPLAPGPAP